MPRLCLAASGGGHLRQILDLKSVWEPEPHLIVTENTALGRSLGEEYPVAFVEHYALGQAKLGRPLKMLRGLVLNLVQSAKIICQYRPNVIITTGAGAVFWTALIGKAFGAKVILIDSFARFDAPSMFARLLNYFADETIVQSAGVLSRLPGARVFDPLRIVDGKRPHKEPVVFVTVGATLDFPRMVEAVLKLKQTNQLAERVIMQVGNTPVPTHLPHDIEVHRELSFTDIKKIIAKSDFVICHGGTGSIITALQAGCRTIVFPRLFSLGEHYDDHQLEIGRAMAARGLVEVVDDEAELSSALDSARNRTPKLATTDTSALAAFIQQRIRAWPDDVHKVAAHEP